MSSWTREPRRQSGGFSRALIGCVVSSGNEKKVTPRLYQRSSSKGDIVDSEWRFLKDYPHDESFTRASRTNRDEGAGISHRKESPKSSTPFAVAAFQAMRQKSKSFVNMFSTKAPSHSSVKTKITKEMITAPCSSEDWKSSYSRRERPPPFGQSRRSVTTSSFKLSKRTNPSSLEDAWIRPANNRDTAKISSPSRGRERLGRELDGFSPRESTNVSTFGFSGKVEVKQRISPTVTPENKMLGNLTKVVPYSGKKNQASIKCKELSTKDEVCHNSPVLSCFAPSSTMKTAEYKITDDLPSERPRNVYPGHMNRPKGGGQFISSSSNRRNAPSRHSAPPSSPSCQHTKRVSSYSRMASYYVCPPHGGNADPCFVTSFSEEFSSSLISGCDRDSHKHQLGKESKTSSVLSPHRPRPGPAENTIENLKSSPQEPEPPKRRQSKRTLRNNLYPKSTSLCETRKDHPNVHNLNQSQETPFTPNPFFERAHSCVEIVENRGRNTSLRLSTFGTPRSLPREQDKRKSRMIFSEYSSAAVKDGGVSVPAVVTPKLPCREKCRNPNQTNHTRTSTNLEDESITTQRTRPTSTLSDKLYMEASRDDLTNGGGRDFGIRRSSSLVSIPSRLRNAVPVPQRRPRQRPVSPLPRARGAENTERQPTCSIYRRGARRWRKLYKINGHLYQAKRFNRRASCAFCKDRIWGLGRQGFKCTQCKLLVHKKCSKLHQIACNSDLDTSCDTLGSHDTSSLSRPGSNGGIYLSNEYTQEGPETGITEESPVETPLPNEIQSTGSKSGEEGATPPGSSITGQYSLDDFELIRVIGRGSYAKVLMVELKRTKRIYAMKVIKKTLVADDEDIDWVQTEKHVFETASNHPFLVGLHSCFQTPSRLFFVIEFVRGGDLMFHMQRQRRLPEEHARFYAAEICLALNFLHEKGIIYRDLKLDNVLLDHEGHIKLTDYGMCKEGIKPRDTTSTFCGTPNYIAPEILQGTEYSFSVDWWALGVLLYEMLAGKSPFDIVGATENQECNTEDFLFQVILERPIRIPRSLSVKAASILKGFLNKNPVDRLGCHPETGFRDIVTHTFFKTIDWEMLEQRQVTPPYRPRLEGDRDLANFPPEFTDEPIQLTPDDQRDIENIDQSEFEGFEYVNPLLMSMEDCV